jgi:hypothetical protein
MSSTDVTYLVGGLSGLIGLAAFIALVIAPAMTSYRRPTERIAAILLSGYILAAFIGVGIVVGVIIVAEWPRIT